MSHKDSAFNRSRYYNADGTPRPNLNAKAEAQKGVPQAGLGKGEKIAEAKSDSIVDTVKNKTSEYATLVKTDKAYTGLALGILSGIGVAYYVNQKKHYGIAGYVGIALAGGAVGYFVGKTIKGGGLSALSGGASGSKDEQIEGKVNGLIDKIVANADKLDIKKNKTEKITTADIAQMKAIAKTELPKFISKFTEREKEIALDGLDSVSKIADEVIASNKKIEPMQFFVWLDTIMKDLGKKYSEKELKDFTEKANKIADESKGKR